MIRQTNYLGAVIVAVFAAVTTAAAPDPIEGHWQGALIREGTVQIILVDTFREAGALKIRIETPDLVTGEPRTLPATFENNRLQFDTGLGKFSLILDAAMGEMIGTVGEVAPPIRIHLKRAFRPTEVPVRTEDVQFRNGAVTLAGTMVLPATPGPYPAVVWIHGRGKSTRAEFRGFARILAQRGVASLIYDKRGAGTSTGDHERSGMYDFAGDAQAAVEFVATRPEIDRKRVGIYGNSAGGWMAAIVANRTKVPLAFIITAVGPADSVRDQQLHVAEYNMRQSGIDFTPDEYAAAAAHMNLVQDFAYTHNGWAELAASTARAKTTRWARFVDLPETESYEDIQWVRLNQYDPGPDLKKIKVPFLALYGGIDYVVHPDANVKKLERYLTEAGNPDFKIVSFPGADHGLTIPPQVHRADGVPDLTYWLWRKRAPGAVELTIEWLLERVKPKMANR